MRGRGDALEQDNSPLCLFPEGRKWATNHFNPSHKSVMHEGKGLTNCLGLAGVGLWKEKKSGKFST